MITIHWKAPKKAHSWLIHGFHKKDRLEEFIAPQFTRNYHKNKCRGWMSPWHTPKHTPRDKVHAGIILCTLSQPELRLGGCPWSGLNSLLTCWARLESGSVEENIALPSRIFFHLHNLNGKNLQLWIISWCPRGQTRLPHTWIVLRLPWSVWVCHLVCFHSPRKL